MTIPKLRVAMTGSAGGGKTSLIAHLLKPIPAATTITYSRPTKAANLLGYSSASEIPEDKLLVYQHYGLMEQIYAERQVMASDAVLMDRTVLDFVGYYLFRVPKESRDFYWNDDLMAKIAKTWLDTNPYDLIVLVPPNSQGTEYRDTRLMEGVQEVHDKIKYIIDCWNLDDLVLRLKTDTPEERAQEVLTAIQKRGFDLRDYQHDWRPM